MVHGKLVSGCGFALFELLVEGRSVGQMLVVWATESRQGQRLYIFEYNLSGHG